jgi:hypothetical protein
MTGGPSMNRLSPLVPRLEKLLLMLSSGSDGEVVSAARAIDRTLRTAGADWHDLTGLLARSAAISSARGKRNLSPISNIGAAR